MILRRSAGVEPREGSLRHISRTSGRRQQLTGTAASISVLSLITIERLGQALSLRRTAQSRSNSRTKNSYTSHRVIMEYLGRMNASKRWLLMSLHQRLLSRRYWMARQAKRDGTMRDVSLFTGVWTGITPVVMHRNGMEFLCETWWAETWFQKRLRALLDASCIGQTSYVAFEEPDA